MIIKGEGFTICQHSNGDIEVMQENKKTITFNPGIMIGPTPNNRLVELPPLPQGERTQATHLNNSGDYVLLWDFDADAGVNSIRQRASGTMLLFYLRFQPNGVPVNDMVDLGKAPLLIDFDSYWAG